MNTSYTYVAFLRGINVGGNKKVPMADLRALFESLSFTGIQTILNTGNVIFEVSETDIRAIRHQIEGGIEKSFGFHVDAIVRKKEDIERLIQLDPFKDTSVTKDTRLYVSFLSNTHKSKLKIPYTSPERDLTILLATDTEVCSVTDLSKGKGTVDAMKVLEKEYGVNITTRNWNTITKLHAKL